MTGQEELAHEEPVTTVTIRWRGDPARFTAALELIDRALVERMQLPDEPRLLARAIAVRAMGLCHIDARGLSVEVHRG